MPCPESTEMLMCPTYVPVGRVGEITVSGSRRKTVDRPGFITGGSVDHFAEAERLLDLSCAERDMAWAQVFATRAQAHATLAGLAGLDKPGRISLPDSGERMLQWVDQDRPQPVQIWCSTDRDVTTEPVIVFQGKDVS